MHQFCIFIVFTSILAIGTAGESPNGKQVLSIYPPPLLTPDLMEDILLDVPGLIKKYGFKCEQYNITTADGYILGLFRFMRKSPPPCMQYPVLLMHGLGGNCAQFVYNKQENSPGFILANAGCDVWLGNARGTHYSNKHTKMNVTNLNYWNFSFNEIGCYDMKAIIDFILTKTTKPKLHFASFSQGGTALLVLLATKPEYNKKIAGASLWSPSTFFKKSQDLVMKIAAPWIFNSTKLTDLLGEGMLKLNPLVNAAIVAAKCNGLLMNPVKFLFCSMLLAYQLDYTDMERYPVYMAHADSGISVQQTIHFLQLYVSGKFCKFDQGEKGNMQMYGKKMPPDYPLNKITAPIAVHYSEDDSINSPFDLKLMYSKLQKPSGLFKIDRPNFGHFDYIIGTDSKDCVYSKMMELIKTRDPKR